MLGNIQELNISGNPLRRIDLTNAYYLQAFEATDTQCDYFYFNYVSPSGTLEKIDIRNNPRMTSDALSMDVQDNAGARRFVVERAYIADRRLQRRAFRH